MQFRLIAEQENGSEQQLESGKVSSLAHPLQHFSRKYLTLEEHDGKVIIGGKTITNLRLADDIDALAEEEQELEALVESLDKTCTSLKWI